MHTELKDEIHELRLDVRHELGAVRQELGAVRHELGAVRSEVRTELSDLRGDFRGELNGVRSEVAYLRGRFDVLIWAAGINAAATIAILGVLLRH